MGSGIKPTVYSHFTLGDMAAYYMLEKEDSQIELMLVPVKKEKELTENLDAMLDSKCLHGDSLIQVKLLDDIYPGAYGPGTSMRSHVQNALIVMSMNGKQILWFTLTKEFSGTIIGLPKRLYGTFPKN